MARPSNNFESSSLTVAFTPQIKQYLDDLTLKGTFGSSPSEAVRMIVNGAIENMLNNGALDRRKWIMNDGKLVLAAS
ncbi:MAG: hypothetical protein ACKO8Z_17045 [Prosthecobacter sp.]